MPPQGGASLEVVSTGLGTGVALNASLAPTSTRWERVVVLDESRAVVLGRSLDAAIALRTEDGGRSWVKLQTELGDALGWGVGDDGSVVIAVQHNGKPPAKGKPAPLASLKLYFAGPRDPDATGPIALLPGEGLLAGAGAASHAPAPVLLSPELASVVVAVGPRKLVFAHGVRAGRAAPEPTAWALGEELVPSPWGRPACLLSLKGGSLFVRPWPKPGEQPAPASPVPGLRVSADGARQLAEGPSCEVGAWSFARLAQPPANAVLVGISPTRSLSFPLPTPDAALLGCSADAVVVQTNDAKTGAPVLIRCTLDGKCTVPKSPPFRIWPEKHDRSVHATPTSQGVVATLWSRAGARWGLSLGQSLDGGALYELPRVIGEGSSERGIIELGALVSFPKRTLLLVSADLTGTTRRGWYAIASDDGGSNWAPP